MKRIKLCLAAGAFIITTASCSKYLDINDNPNQATSATPELILPQALTASANVQNLFNTYGSEIGLFAANAGGYGGFGESITYNYTTSFTNTWATTYDNLEDYQAIINKTAGIPTYNFYNAVAKIMSALEFQMLVDQYNEIPYTEAVKGSDNLTPEYTDGATVYKDLADKLDSAILLIDQGTSVPAVAELGEKDVVFGGDIDSWKKLANTIKLRLILRGGDKVSFTNKTFSADGFLTTDALINPGFRRDNGKQNPQWNTWAYGYTGSAGNKAWMPSTFVFGFYDGHTLKDTGRGEAIFYQFPGTGNNRLGIESNDLQASPTGSFWFSGTNRNGSSNGNQVGILKGPDAGQPIMLAAESYFLQAEAAVRGLISGDAEALFYQGITESFGYIYQLPDLSQTADVDKLVDEYKADNPNSKLVNYSLLTSNEEKIKAIITQKFIALNFINGQEAWNEYRRTGYPTVNPTGDGYETFASSVSESPRPDKLPTRTQYPVTEGSYNSENVPTGISPFTSVIFWAK